jgi:glycogen debranching enzyme
MSVGFTGSRLTIWERSDFMVTTRAKITGCPPRGYQWFVTLFGRDSLLAGLQNMMVNPGFCSGSAEEIGGISGCRSR